MRTRSSSAALATCLTGTVAAALIVGGAPATAATVPAAASDTPENVIVMIGDGMGYNTVDAASLYEYGTTYKQVGVTAATGEVAPTEGTASQVFERFPVQTSVSTYPVGSGYDPAAAWSDFDYINGGTTDSAAAGTALATGTKTVNGAIGVTPEGEALENITERAEKLGKATGVVSSVPFSHATPSAYVAHNTDRNDLQGIADEMLESDVDVIIGAGHPYFDDDAQPREGDYTYLSEERYAAVKNGDSAFTLVEDTEGLEALQTGAAPEEQVFGLVPVGTTLQQARSSLVEQSLPFSSELNDVPDLADLSLGALNVLSQKSDEGMFAMIEGGAIDWAGHANSLTTNVEETVDFTRAVDAVTGWVEQNSSWDETLLIVTADHETGYITGDGSNPDWTVMTGEQGELPLGVFNSGNHTNQLVPVYAIGAGSDAITARATGTDPVRGAYLDNTDLGNIVLEDFWTEEPAASVYDVTVTALGPNRARMIAAAVRLTGYTEAEIRAAVARRDSNVVLDDVSRATAERAERVLEAAGATVVLVPQR